MPLYEYHCPTCDHKFDRLQPMSATGADCPVCEQPARRAISVFAATLHQAGGVEARRIERLQDVVAGGG